MPDMLAHRQTCRSAQPAAAQATVGAQSQFAPCHIFPSADGAFFVAVSTDQQFAELSYLAGQPQWFAMSLRIEALVKAEKKLNPNVAFYSTSTYHVLGIAIDLFTPIFAVSRVSGWTAHVLEQYANNRLIRPRAEYIGPEYPQRYLPVEQR